MTTAVALMDGLIDAGHDVTMLTNFAADTFVEARERFPFLDGRAASPSRARSASSSRSASIYDLHAATFGLEPSATLFIDDSQKNVDGAKAAGWQAVLFQNAKTLEADLERFGITP